MGKWLPKTKSTEPTRETESPKVVPDISATILTNEYILAMWRGDDKNEFLISQEEQIVKYKSFAEGCIWKAPSAIRALAWRPGSIFAANGNQITHWKSNFTDQRDFVGHDKFVLSIDASHSTPELISGGRDYSVHLWDIEKLTSKSVSIERNVVTSLKWRQGEAQFIHCSEDRMLRLWDTRGMEVVSSINVGENFAVCCDVNDNYVVTGHRGFDSNGTVARLWDIRVSKQLQEFSGHTQTVDGTVLLDEFLITCSKDGTVRKYGTKNQAIHEVFHNPEGNPYNRILKFNEGILAASGTPSLQYVEIFPTLKTAINYK